MTLVTVPDYRLCRLYDQTKDNPAELTVGVDRDGEHVALLMIDRDDGNTELEIVVRRDELQAALAMTQVDVRQEGT